MEFALIAPVLFAVLLGMVTGGLALAAKNSMTNAVREGGRLGATLPEGSDWTAGWATEVRGQVVSLSGGDLEMNEVCVQMLKVGTDPPLGEACNASLVPLAPATPSTATAGSCVVKVWARRSADLDVIFFSRSLVLDAQAVGLYERSGCE